MPNRITMGPMMTRPVTTPQRPADRDPRGASSENPSSGGSSVNEASGPSEASRVRLSRMAQESPITRSQVQQELAQLRREALERPSDALRAAFRSDLRPPESLRNILREIATIRP